MFRPPEIGYSRAIRRVTFDLQLYLVRTKSHGMAHAHSRSCGWCIRMSPTPPSASLLNCAADRGSADGKPTTPSHNRQPAASWSCPHAFELNAFFSLRLISCAAGNLMHGGSASQVSGSMRETYAKPEPSRNSQPQYTLPNYSRAIASFGRFSPSVSIGSSHT